MATTETLTGTYSAGLYVHANYTGVTLTSTAQVLDTGLYIKGYAGVYNSGFINETAGARYYGVELNAGGTLENDVSATVGGYIAVYGRGANASHVINSGSIIGSDIGVTLQSGGEINNSALISGGDYGIRCSGSAAVTVRNYGTVQGLSKAVLLAAGTVNNLAGGLIDGNYAITGVGPITVDNSGTVGLSAADLLGGYQGVNLKAGGRLTNEAGGLIAAKDAVIAYDAQVINYGTVDAAVAESGAYGVGLTNGASLANGSVRNESALIEGYTGVTAMGATTSVVNFATIQGVGLGGQAGVYVSAGHLTNGAATDTRALIEAYSAVVVAGAGTATNFGAIVGDNPTLGSYAVLLSDGGRLTNGTGASTAARVEGYGGVEATTKAAVVANYAAIEAEGGGARGVFLAAGGTVTNGGGPDRTALIAGDIGVGVAGAAGTVRNLGTIQGLGGEGDYGVMVANGGSVSNGSATNGVALISGYGGVRHSGAGTVTNWGTIQALGDTASAGVLLTAGGRLMNGAAGHAGALIEGYDGVVAAGSTTVTNFATIDGEGGTAVKFTAAGDLAVEAGSVFIGSIVGGGGTLELASGVGTLTGLLAGDDVTVSGSMAKTTFDDFTTVAIDSGASFALAGAGGTIAAGQNLVLGGALTGAGTLALTGGTATFATGASLAIAQVTESGATATASFTAASLTVADVWTQTAGTITIASGDKASFTGTGDRFSGTLAGAGTIAFTGGTDTLSGTHLTAASEVIDGAAVTLAGTLDLSKTLSVTSTDLTVAAAGASLTGGGTVSLSDSAANVIKGASAGATLTVVSGRIVGAGQLGDGEMALTVDAGGTIDGYLGVALTINLGANTLANAGLIESAGAGGTAIFGAVNNTGTLEAIKGTLTVDGAVSGAGSVRIAGGTADFASTFSQNVAFTAAGGVLELAKSQSYTGQITGFAKTAVTSLDLSDIAFGSKTKATFSGTTASGTLTVTDGTHTAKITLVGNYTASTFTAASDGHGGTTVTDPPAALSAATRPILSLVTAMAGLTAGAGGPLAATAAPWRPPPPMGLVRPQIA